MKTLLKDTIKNAVKEQGLTKITPPKEYLMGEVCYKNAKYDVALSFFLKAIKKQPHHANSWFKSGMCYMHLGDLQQSYEHLNHAIQLQPDRKQWNLQLEQCQRLLSKKTVTKSTAKPSPAKKSNAKEIIPPKENLLFSNIVFTDDVAVYFDGTMGNIYQVQQWFGPFYELSKTKSLVFIVRNKEVYDYISGNTKFQVVYCRLIDNVMQVYEQGNFKCVLYVNNAQKNFQSLIVNSAYHVHINHGESDKVSTTSNQAKAYDYVFIVGQAAYDKYNNNLINKDMNKFIQIGRPQLEHIDKIDLNIPKDCQVILYAPTWEGTHESMNYTSLNDFGEFIVDSIIERPDLFLIYKPHPNTGSRDKATKSASERIIKKLNSCKNAQVILEGDINSIYEYVDIAIFDNSAVAIDYLATDKPMLMTDMFYKTTTRQDMPIITQSAKLIDDNNIQNVIEILLDEIYNDHIKQQRDKIKQYFLGDIDYVNKESTKKFIETIDNICKERDIAISRLSMQS